MKKAMDFTSVILESGVAAELLEPRMITLLGRLELMGKEPMRNR